MKGKKTRSSPVRLNNWPRTVIVASQEPCPTSFETSKAYSPLSLFSALIILSTELLSVLCTLNLGLELSSLPAFNHLAFSGFVPENRASSVAGSPWVTLTDFDSSVILAGSETSNKVVKKGSSEASLTWPTTTQHLVAKNSTPYPFQKLSGL